MLRFASGPRAARAEAGMTGIWGRAYREKRFTRVRPDEARPRPSSARSYAPVSRSPASESGLTRPRVGACRPNFGAAPLRSRGLPASPARRPWARGATRRCPFVQPTPARSRIDVIRTGRASARYAQSCGPSPGSCRTGAVPCASGPNDRFPSDGATLPASQTVSFYRPPALRYAYSGNRTH